MKKIALGDLGEFWYGDYKEPFEQLEGAVPGHPVGVLLKDDEGKVLCAWCGKAFHNLGRHVVARHGMTARDYKQEVGLLQKSSLVSERLRLRRSAQGKQMVARLGGRVAAASTLRDAHAKHRVYGPNPSLRTPERLNLTGRCYSQLLAVGAAILREEGRVTQPRLRRRGVSEKSVLAFWPSMDAYRQAIGDTYRSAGHHTDAQLLAALRSLALKLGRTPTGSDLRRYGLPYLSTFAHRFGTYATACERAGLMPNLPVPTTTDSDVAALVAYATTGTLRKAAAATGIGANRIGRVMHRYGAPFGVLNGHGMDTQSRRQWAADMARRLAGMPDEVAA